MQELSKFEGQLKRVVVEEAHQLLTSILFRPKLQRVLELVRLCPRALFVSASVPPSMLEDLLKQVELPPHRCVSIRSNAPDGLHLQYGVTRATSRELAFFQCKSAIEDWCRRSSGSARCLVFVLTREDCVQFARTLATLSDVRVEQYQAGVPAASRTEVIESLSRQCAEKQTVIVATSSLGVGVDIADVSAVFHLGGALSLLDYRQQCGRGGRSGQKCKCEWFQWPDVLKTVLYIKSVSQRSQWERIEELELYVGNSGGCRRAMLSSSSETSSASCKQIKSSGLAVELCDNCELAETTLPHNGTCAAFMTVHSSCKPDSTWCTGKTTKKLGSWSTSQRSRSYSTLHPPN